MSAASSRDPRLALGSISTANFQLLTARFAGAAAANTNRGRKVCIYKEKRRKQERSREVDLQTIHGLEEHLKHARLPLIRIEPGAALPHEPL
jgi:hypothetical protein